MSGRSLSLSLARTPALTLSLNPSALDPNPYSHQVSGWSRVYVTYPYPYPYPYP